MCWSSCQKPTKHIASEDIPVQKIVHISDSGEYESPYYLSCKWRLNEVYTTDLDRPKYKSWMLAQCWVINCGFHSCKQIKRQSDGFVEVNSERIVMGYIEPSFKIVNAIIPKGSRYYVNSDNFYVSDKLMLIDSTKQQSSQTKNLFSCVGQHLIKAISTLASLKKTFQFRKS